MGVLSRLRRRHHHDIKDKEVIGKTVHLKDVIIPSDRKKRVTLRIPMPLFHSASKICKDKGLSFNEGSCLLFKWLAEQEIEFEIVRRVRKRATNTQNCM